MQVYTLDRPLLNRARYVSKRLNAQCLAAAVTSHVLGDRPQFPHGIFTVGTCVDGSRTSI